MYSSIPLILCVDDEIAGLEARRILLEHAGYQVLTANNGRAGIEVFREQPVSAVILDYSMPGITGGEVASTMRQVKPKVPIVLHTATVTLPQHVFEVVDVYVNKAAGVSALLERLSQVLDTVAEPVLDQ